MIGTENGGRSVKAHSGRLYKREHDGLGWGCYRELREHRKDSASGQLCGSASRARESTEFVQERPHLPRFGIPRVCLIDWAMVDLEKRFAAWLVR